MVRAVERRRALGFLFVAILAAVDARAQDVLIGTNAPYAGNVNPPRTQTFLSFLTARGDATIRSVTFGWSATGCAAAVKVKFFRFDPVSSTWNFVEERGPFDVTAPLTPGGTSPPAVQTVAFDAPVRVFRMDAIALANVTACGGPTWAIPPAVPLPPIPNFAFTLVVDGDRTGPIGPSEGTGAPQALGVYGVGTLDDIPLLDGRFLVYVTATDPRTGRTGLGAGHVLGLESGYFGLPDVTGNADVAEVMVKMVDATTAPPPFGGAYWFFYSSLTDIPFTLTVTDVVTGRVRVYESAGSPAFCGAGDTNAFPP